MMRRQSPLPESSLYFEAIPQEFGFYFSKASDAFACTPLFSASRADVAEIIASIDDVDSSLTGQLLVVSLYDQLKACSWTVNSLSRGLRYILPDDNNEQMLAPRNSDQEINEAAKKKGIDLNKRPQPPPLTSKRKFSLPGSHVDHSNYVVWSTC